MTLLTVIFAEALIFLLMIVTRPAVPPVVPFDTVVHQLVSGEADRRVEVQSSVSPGPVIGSASNASARVLASAVRKAIGDSRLDVRAHVAWFGPPSVFGVQSEEDVASGEAPIVIVGDFTLSMPLSDGSWRTITTDGRFMRAVHVRLALLIFGTLIVVAPFAYVMARKATGPIRKFATAADRLGRDPYAPALEVGGPAELQLAGEAFNRMQQRLTSYVEERTTVMAAVAHDIRTPLMRIAFLMEDAPPELKQRIEAQVAEMRRLVDAVLRFLRDEADRHRRERVDVVSIVQAAVEDLRDQGKSLDFAVPGRPIIIDADPAGLRTVLANLLGNAMTYGSRAQVIVQEGASKFTIEICDDGPGIPEDELNKVFDPFYRLERSRNRATGGVGLGLAIVRSIVVAHGGTVTLHNRAPTGLCARVEMPS